MDNLSNPEIVNGLIYFVVLLSVFVAIRELVNWYWKINERVKLMQQMVEQNEIIISKLESLQHVNSEPDIPRLVANQD